MKLTIIFRGEVNFFLSRTSQRSVFKHTLARKASVKDIVESFRVPHTEIGNLLFNRMSVDFSFNPESDGELVVEEIKSPYDVTRPSYLRKEALDELRFLADVNVMKLGRLLIMLGFDVQVSDSFSDKTIARIADEEKRVVLTRDTDLLKRKKIVFARRLRNHNPYDQLYETLHFFGITGPFNFFSRCSSCNTRLERIEKEKIIHRLAPKTKKYYNTFYICPDCMRIFWKGSHHDSMKKRFESKGIKV
ncbi:MAG: Mut7-C ubiquitin/RNAse domain-containing protein [Desulfarculaceae bacterium]|nr:Mut7-C ubiquitin/RNAse domain-containing protein [Desulfarculaceae bacterium]